MSFHFLQNVEERVNKMCRNSAFDRQPIVAEFSCGETGEIRPYVTDACTEYELSLKLVARFWANKAQYSKARNRAERYLVEAFAGDAFMLIGRAEKAVFDGDREAAFRWLGELHDLLEHRAT